MDHYPPLFSFLAVLLTAAVASHAALPSEDYWQKMLPNTTMPDTIRDLLHTDGIKEKSGTSVDVGVGVGVGVSVGVGPGNGGPSVDVGKGGVGVDVGHKRKSVIVRVLPKSPFDYTYTASAEQINDDPTVALFFLEKDLHPGKQMSLFFTNTTPGAAFLPQQAANSIPFSSDKLQEILHHFSIQPQSPEADAMKGTIQRCEEPAMKGESQCCATSLESMIDFATSILGAHVQVLTTTVSKAAPKQRYSIGSGVQKLMGPESVTCHGQAYVYAVYYCHVTSATKVYVVPLIGEDGTRVDAVAVCHTDTSTWNPGHVAFQMLKVKPGSVPICHFLPLDHVVWVQS
ncbi:BURP domain-containing protein 3-like [Magnolia sinica]|uniref:BURP domain-containing protein 3-like n=1 Tax=Magnolia sinica TaxID=86752 RepID=UPI002657FA9D|nr:BURP domain-containing protein 3-like [Magnolia sinica]